MGTSLFNPKVPFKKRVIYLQSQHELKTLEVSGEHTYVGLFTAGESDMLVAPNLYHPVSCGKFTFTSPLRMVATWQVLHISNLFFALEVES